jgi:hypothetical protein
MHEDYGRTGAEILTVWPATRSAAATAREASMGGLDKDNGKVRVTI